jgi:hypothetical protein
VRGFVILQLLLFVSHHTDTLFTYPPLALALSATRKSKTPSLWLDWLCKPNQLSVVVNAKTKRTRRMNITVCFEHGQKPAAAGDNEPTDEFLALPSLES